MNVTMFFYYFLHMCTYSSCILLCFVLVWVVYFTLPVIVLDISCVRCPHQVNNIHTLCRILKSDI